MPYHPQQLLKPCNAGFYYFCKRKREINRDSSCVILSKISTLSTSVIISWKAKKEKGKGERKRKKKKRKSWEKVESKKWGFVGGGHCTSAASEYLKGKRCSQLGTQKYGGAVPSCCNLDTCSWKRNLPK